MHPTSELIQRHNAAFQNSAVTLFNPPRDSLAQELFRAGASRVEAFTQDFGDYQFLEAAGILTGFGLLPDAQHLGQHIILFLPREKDRLEFLLHFLSAHMAEDAIVWLVGENKAGIKSADSRLRKRFSQVQKRDSARHCGLYQASVPVTGEDFELQAYCQQWTLPTAQGELKFTSLPGSFAHGRLDRGTAVLLEFLESPAAEKLGIGGRVIDFGCGVGVIGLVLKQRNPSTELEMLDTSASALESARRSSQANGMTARIIAASGLEGLHGRCDWIISNPPFHAGVATDLDIAQRMIAHAPVLLGKRGRMLLVCNRHLPYEGWLAESFTSQKKLAENREFKVLLAYGARS